MNHYVDFHTHTNLSDSLFSVRQLIDHAAEAHIQYLAISDHNRIIKESELEGWFGLARKYQMVLLPGCEMSSSYISDDGRESEIHINCLLYQPGASPNLEKIALYNRDNDQSGRVNKILERLKSCGVDLHTSFDDLRCRYPRTHHIGRAVIATEVVRQGFAATRDEVFRELLNETGKAYVKNNFTYADMEDVLCAARDDQALAVLCHPLSYSNISDESSLYALLQRFKTALNGSPGALECEYRRYSQQQRELLREMAAEFGLLVSCGSDSHGDDPSELDNRFPAEIYHDLRAAHERYYVGGTHK